MEKDMNRVYLVYLMKNDNKTTIKVSRQTIERLHKVIGQMTIKTGRRVTLNDAIDTLLDSHELSFDHSDTFEVSLRKDREAFLSLLDDPFHGLEPGDLKEYDFDDVGE
jgi:hypothetical protein